MAESGGDEFDRPFYLLFKTLAAYYASNEPSVLLETSHS
jgi:hypothetical protein